MNRTPPVPPTVTHPDYPWQCHTCGERHAIPQLARDCEIDHEQADDDEPAHTHPWT